MTLVRRLTSRTFNPTSLPNCKPYTLRRRRVGFTHLAHWSLEEVQARYKEAEARVAVLHGRRVIKGMADADVKVWRAVPADQRRRTLKLAQEEMNALRDELRRRM
jgi:acyl-CoA reductase-like NAD-dependent aldehyde dehydrogenase